MRVLGLLATIDHVDADTDDDDGANGHGGHVVALGLLLGDLFLFGLWLGHVLIGKGLVGVGDGFDQAVVVGMAMMAAAPNARPQPSFLSVLTG